MGWDGDAERESLEGVETIVRAFFFHSSLTRLTFSAEIGVYICEESPQLSVKNP